MNNFKIKPDPIRILFILLSIACMIVIFMFSMEDSGESSETSGRITGIIVEICVPDYEKLSESRRQEILLAAEHIVRKTAHFTIYAALGFCISCAVGRRRLISAGSFISLSVSFVYACSDELHQYFVPGRSCESTDILIDTTGSICGILFSLLCMYIITHFSAKNRSAA